MEEAPKKSFKNFSISFKYFVLAFWKTILAWVIIVSFVVVAIHLNVDKSIIGGAVVIFGIISQAFIGLLNIIGLIPIIGPIVAKVLALPFFWLLNAMGYFVSILAIKKGYTSEVVNYRILTVVFLIGIVIGFILGKLI
ncbi:hypothetical protein [Caldithrix abyssi]|uniref:Uncharacterized protein n=1 Tax=Caldithrix abyssi DSM 13497 TaxID=880073 RepID=H1XU47_CALAY|nr:hypothetical protein [Caldithrix abyssi]APF17436.1 hypothetical protein Cabys_685 [Caldithrix abyssi DSM 13497]EHO41537.1 hypothetical protein Calab_1923 [Caldithrix abyssi DSM 13497]